MISLRQHLFSLIAVFVALAVGIAAGSTVVRGPLLDSTRARLESAEEVIAAERAENELLAAEVAQLDGWAVDGPQQLLVDQLEGRVVLLVAAGDVDSDVVAGTIRSIRASGGVLFGEVRIDTVVFEPDSGPRLGAAIGGDPADPDVVRSFGEELTRRLLEVAAAVTSSREPVEPRDVLGDSFGDLEDLGLVDLLAVARDPLAAEQVDVLMLTDRNLVNDPAAVLIPILEIAGGDGGVDSVVVGEVGRVLEGNDAPVPSFVSLIRDDGRLRDEVATVDNAETFLGWIAMVLATVDAAAGEVGHFGFREGADRSVPPAAP
jgi:hypothetical protein